MSGFERSLVPEQTYRSAALTAHLPSQLPDTVNELNKNRRAVGVGVVFVAMTNTLKEEAREERTVSDTFRQAIVAYEDSETF